MGRRKCSLLAEKLPNSIDVFVSSCEPKAVETAQILAEHHGKEWQIFPGLHEHDRTNLPLLAPWRFEALVAEFFRQPDQLVMGKETAEEAYRRFDQAVLSVVTKHRGRNIAIVSHGTVISLYVSGGVAQVGHRLWRRLGLPSCIVLSMPERRILDVNWGEVL
ncbi:MAG: histidine phosphatase family protein [Acidobacteriota bacterium]